MNKSLLASCIGCISIFSLIFSGNGLTEELSAKKKIKPNEFIKIVETKTDIALKEERKSGIDIDIELDKDFDDDFGSDEEEIFDPFEPFNRLVWAFDEKLFDYALKPIATGFQVIPEPFRHVIKNFFSNISTPIYLASSILQNSKEKIDRSIGRFLINSTLGIGGLFDPAKSIFKIKKVNEDLDQALGYHKVPFGPFIMLPVFGPSTLRGVAAKITQTFLSPEFFLGIGVLPATEARSLEMVNEVSLNLEQIEGLTTFALDPYTSIKDFYIQRRKVLVQE